MSEKIYTFKSIKTLRLQIRMFQKEDREAYFDLFSNPLVMQYLPIEPFQKQEEASKALEKIAFEYENGLFYRLAVEEIYSKECIGYIGLSRMMQRQGTCEVVYAYREAFWNKGYAVEALTAYVAFLENTYHTIIGGHVDENKVSGYVLEKCGFVRKPDLDTEMTIHGNKKHIYNYIKERKQSK